MKKNKATRVGVEAGFGPRHAMNAQEGSEAVPSGLPEPPAEELKFRRNSFGNLRPAMLAKMLGQELGGLSKEDVAKLAISLLMGGEGPEPMPVGGVPKMKQPGLKVSETGPRYEGPPTLTPGSKEWLAEYGKSAPDEANLPMPPTPGTPEWEQYLNPYKKPEPHFPSLNKPPYDALKYPEGTPMSEKGTPLPPEGAQHEPDISKLTPEQQKEWLDASPTHYWSEAEGKMMPYDKSSEEEPPFEPNVPRYRKGKRTVQVHRGYGPTHANNAKEGEDLTQQNTDTVPAMLTPREAVLNRNAAELAGRDKIEALNEEGNELAKKGVDLAAKGDDDVKGLSAVDAKEMQATLDWIEEHAKGSGINPGTWIARLMQSAGYPTDVPKYEKQVVYPEGDAKGQTSVAAVKAPGSKAVASGNVMKYVLPGELRRQEKSQLPKLAVQKGEENVKMKSKPKQGNVPQYSKLPAPPQSGGGFYPQGATPFASGTGEVGIGDPDPQAIGSNFGAMPQLSGQNLGPLVAAIKAEAQKQGLNAGQISSILGAFKGLGGGASPSGGDLPYDQLGGQYASFSGGQPGYQGGISDIGYPPMLMPDAEYHADKGSNWVGPYDPAYLIQRYSKGTGEVPGLRRGSGDFDPGAWADPGNLGFNTGPGGFGRPSTMASGGGGGGGQGFVNRSSFNPGAWGGGQPGFPWSPTAIQTTYNPQGYPYGVPVQGPDQNVQGVGRTHNLRKNQ